MECVDIWSYKEPPVVSDRCWCLVRLCGLRAMLHSPIGDYTQTLGEDSTPEPSTSTLSPQSRGIFSFANIQGWCQISSSPKMLACAAGLTDVASSHRDLVPTP